MYIHFHIHTYKYTYTHMHTYTHLLTHSCTFVFTYTKYPYIHPRPPRTYLHLQPRWRRHPLPIEPTILLPSRQPLASSSSFVIRRQSAPIPPHTPISRSSSLSNFSSAFGNILKSQLATICSNVSSLLASQPSIDYNGVAPISRLVKTIGLFCRISSIL